MKKNIHFLFVSIFLLLLSNNVFAGKINIAVASNFNYPMQKLANVFTKDTGHIVNISFASTGKLFAQIKNNAPFDIFLAADKNTPKKLEDLGLGVIGTRKTYAIGKLALWSPKPYFTSGEKYLKQQKFSYLAIGDPKIVPYGLAAKQVFQHLQLWKSLQDKIVRGHSIAQTFQFIASGNIRTGLVSLSQIKKWQDKYPRGNDSIWIIPQSFYLPIKQQAILLKNGQNNYAAREFLYFLYSKKAKQIIKNYGYEVIF